MHLGELGKDPLFAFSKRQVSNSLTEDMERWFFLQDTLPAPSAFCYTYYGVGLRMLAGQPPTPLHSSLDPATTIGGGGRGGSGIRYHFTGTARAPWSLHLQECFWKSFTHIHALTWCWVTTIIDSGVFSAPFFAYLSAFSLPLTPTCPNTHKNLLVCPWWAIALETCFLNQPQFGPWNRDCFNCSPTIQENKSLGWLWECLKEILFEWNNKLK